MPSAAYFRLKAQETFQAANLEPDVHKAERMRTRGRDYSELAQAVDRIQPSSARNNRSEIEGREP